MRDFNSLSGPWNGLSTQDGVRISESIQLRIDRSVVDGCGYDKDGDFELVGDYDAKSQRVRLTRRYTWTTEPSQEGVGIAYDYTGVWDGMMVSGMWCSREHPFIQGPFEMWPATEQDLQALSLEMEMVQSVGAS